MTRFSVEPSSFLRYVALAARISEKSPDPQTEYMQVTVSLDSVSLSAVSMISTIVAPVKTGITVDAPGTFIVNSAKLFKIVRGADKKIVFTTTDTSVVIEIGQYVWTLPLINSIDKLDIGQTTVPIDSYEFDSEPFIAALRACKRVVSTDPTRWAYQQVAVIDGAMIASDGMQYVKYPVDAPDMVLPSAAINDLLLLEHVNVFPTFMHKKLDTVHVFYTNDGIIYTVMESGYEFPVSESTFRSAKVASTEANTFLVFGELVTDALAAVDKVSPEFVSITNLKDAIVFDSVGEDHSSATIEIEAAGLASNESLHVSFERLHKYMDKQTASFQLSFLGEGAPLRLVNLSGNVEYVLFQAVAPQG